MNSDFPILNIEQVALLRADVNTGIVLDENYHRSIKGQPFSFTVFDNTEHAEIAAQQIISKHPDVECSLYRKGQTFVKCISRFGISYPS